LGSSCLETDGAGAVISYEEYHPFGTTAYSATLSSLSVSAKRYRSCGKERDEESGLYYYGARYYASWLGRFVSVDALKDKYPQWSSYQYTGNNPVTFYDLDGNEPAENEKANVKPPEQTPIGTPDNTSVAGPVEPKLGGNWLDLRNMQEVKETLTNAQATERDLVPLLPEVTIVGQIESLGKPSIFDGKGPLTNLFGYKEDPDWAKEGQADGAYGSSIGIKGWRAAAEAYSSIGTNMKIIAFPFLYTPAAPIATSVFVVGEITGDVGDLGVATIDLIERNFTDAAIGISGVINDKKISDFISGNKTITAYMKSDEVKALKDLFSISIDFLSDFTKNIFKNKTHENVKK